MITFDPWDPPKVTAGSDHYISTCCLYIRSSFHPSIRTFENLAKQDKFQGRRVSDSDTVRTVCLAEWIIDHWSLMAHMSWIFFRKILFQL